MDLEQIEAEIKDIESKISALVFKKNNLLKLKKEKLSDSKNIGSYIKKNKLV